MCSAIFRALFIGAFLTPFISQSAIEDLTILTSPDGKQFVILAGDIHDREPGTQPERLAAAIAECQKNDLSPFEVHIEKPAMLFTMFDDTPRITTDLEPALRALNVPGVTVHDCEVRNVSILAFWLFGKKYPSSSGCSIETGTKSCAVDTATLKDLDDEFEELHDSLAQFATGLNGKLREKFEEELMVARNQMNAFRKRVVPYIHESNLIIETAIKLAEYDRENSWTYERERIENLALDPFSQLFNLNIIRTIILPMATKQLYIAGLLHTRLIKKFCLDNSWKINRVQNADQHAVDPEFISFSPISKKDSALEE